MLLYVEEGLAHLVDGCVEFEFEHYFAYVEGMGASDGRCVGAEDAVGEGGAEAVGEVGGEVVEQVAVAVTQVDVDEAREGWVVEELALGHLGEEHLPVVACGYLAYDVGVG